MLGMKPAILAMALAGGLSACATTTTTGRAIYAAAAAQLQPGVTTVADAQRLLGPPFQTIRSSDGGTLLTYARTTVQQHGLLSTAADVDSQTLVLVFDAAGVLVRTTGSASNAAVR